jgi:hypothetical protein
VCSLSALISATAIVLLEGLGALKTINDPIGIRTRNLPACSIAPQPLTTINTVTNKYDNTLNRKVLK